MRPSVMTLPVRFLCVIVLDKLGHLHLPNDPDCHS